MSPATSSGVNGPELDELEQLDELLELEELLELD